jgi:hypothetical protein
MRAGDLGANTRGAMWHNRIEEADHVNAFLQHACGELLRLCRVANHDRDDRMHARLDAQAAFGQAATTNSVLSEVRQRPAKNAPSPSAGTFYPCFWTLHALFK